jgi:asparagine synthase (glutamine-hydrolysing)
MCARYALAFGRGAHRHALRERALGAGFTVRADLPGMLLIADEATPVITGTQWAAVGQIFARGGERLQRAEGPGSTREVDPTASGYWGNFVLFSIGSDGSANVYREPSGSIPVYHVVGDGGDMFVSDADLATSLGLLERAEVDPGFAVRWLQFPHLRTGRSGLKNVHEVLPATIRHEVGGQWIDELGWDPWRHARGEIRLSDFQAAADTLRSVALRVIPCQMPPGPVLLQLSGGVDSSIIAASLHHAGLSFSAVTFATCSADGDERRYARAVADTFAVPLKEITEDELPCLLMSPIERTFRPGSNPVLLPLDQAVERHRREIGAALLVDGGGGDNLFCYLTSAAPVVDALRSARPRAALEAARDVAERADATFWQVAKAAVRRGLPAGRRCWKEDRRFLKKDALQPGPDRHPWLASSLLSPPGKRDHIASLVQIHHFLDRRIGAGTPALHPLMAQPLLELCLAIPTWLWVRGGIDRAVAREAFRGLLPPLIVGRRTKGSLQGLFHRFFARLRCDLRDLLLGGDLRAFGIIDAVAVELAFAGERWTGDEIQMRLSEMAALELWLHSWRG